jgi:uncharacterized membrane protein YraQ (UPF0718 family)
MGAGIGPATAFLYSGPAINVLAIILTGRVLGVEMGIARAVGAIAFGIVIGLSMQLLFERKGQGNPSRDMALPDNSASRPLWQVLLYFAFMIGILVFANWVKPVTDRGIWQSIYSARWFISSIMGAGLAATLILILKMSWWKVFAAAVPAAAAALAFPGRPLIAFTIGAAGLSAITAPDQGEPGDWFSQTWDFAKQIAPLLLLGVAAAGFFLGREGHEGLVPSQWISALAGGNSPGAVFFASVAGALMYFATLTEVPILQGLIVNGMGKGPALALLLAGPALSLQSILVLHRILGLKKTAAYIFLVIMTASAAGLLYGTFF